MRTTNWAMVALGIAVVVAAVAVPGFQWWAIVLGAMLTAWGSFGLLAEP